MSFITLTGKTLPFVKTFTAIVICFTAANIASAQKAAKFEFHDLEEQIKINSATDPLFNLRKTRSEEFKDLSETSARDLKTAGENTAPSAGELDPTFNPSIQLLTGTVRATAAQTDGKFIAAGFFKTVNGSRHDNIVRFNADNSIDESFSASTNGSVFAAAIQTDGKILIAGVFTEVNGITRNSAARLNADGSLDSTFSAGGGADNLIYDIAIQPDGKILIGGNFVIFNNSFKPYVVRLNADGSIDETFSTTFQPPVPGILPSVVYSLALQNDGKILLGGAIVTNPASPAFKPILRLNTNGSIDDSFDAGAINSNLYKVALQSDGKIVIGGFFSSINGVTRRYIARLKSEGSLDESFNAETSVDAPVTSLCVKPDGKILTGSLRSLGGFAKQLNGDGMLDITFNPNGFIAGGVNSISITAGGKIFFGSSVQFTFFTESNAAFLFNPDGMQDTTFSFTPTSASSVTAIAVQPDAKILIAGTFDHINETSTAYIVRLNTDGTLDPTFSLGNGSSTTFISSGLRISKILLQPDGKILIGGAQISTGDMNFSSIVRLNQDGSYDNSFIPAVELRFKTASAVTLRPDGKILFAYTVPDNSGQFTGGISRLNADGSLDPSFNFGLAPVIESIIALPDGKVLAGGPFGLGFINSGTGQNEFYYGLIRLNEDGSLDSAFRAGFVTNESGFTSVHSIARQTDGKFLVGGTLFTGSSTMPFGVARLNETGAIDGTFQLTPVTSTSDIARVEKLLLLANGKILAGGRFNNFGGAANANIARLNANGTIDTTFQANTDKTVLEIAQQADGKVLIGGLFDLVNGTPRTYLARLLSEPVAPRRTKFDFDGDGKSDISVFRPSDTVWYLNNSTNGFTAIQWGLSNDKLTPADYDGDGKTDVAVYRGGIWYLLGSTDGFTSVQWGLAGDIPQPADFDGDGKAELAVYRPSEGVWYWLNLANNQFTAVQFGISEDKPVAGDYDGDGKTDIAVFRPSNSVWYILKSSGGVSTTQWGIASDKPVPADYDGDGKTDLAVYRDGVWYVLKSSDQGNLILQWGISTDIPAPADYDGDGRADLAVYRDGVWYLLQTTGGISIFQFGLTDDKPIANSFVY